MLVLKAHNVINVHRAAVSVEFTAQFSTGFYFTLVVLMSPQKEHTWSRYTDASLISSKKRSHNVSMGT